MTTIIGIDLLPTNPFAGSSLVALIITSSVPSYYRIRGIDLHEIVQVDWYPENPTTVEFQTRQVVLIDNTEGTFMIRVTDNFLDITDRKGKLSFRLQNGTTLAFPVQTVGPVDVGRLWQSPYEGLITGE
jgi:hypothetical protein